MTELYIELADGGVWYPGRTDNTISLNVIAHSLSSLGRFTGHAKRINGHIYTVAEHSVKVSYLVKTRTALLHDAPECITNDLSKPNKTFIGGSYGELEQSCWDQIATEYDLADPLPHDIKEADRLMVFIEAFDLMPSRGHNYPLQAEYRERALELYIRQPELRPECWPAPLAKQKFLERFEKVRWER